MNLSNAITDFILFASSILLVLLGGMKIQPMRLRIYWNLFPVLIGLTAFFGGLRFLGVENVRALSGMLQYAGSTFGVVALAASVLYAFESRYHQGWLNTAMGAATVLFFVLVFSEKGQVGLILQGPAIALILLLSLMQFRKSPRNATLMLMALILMAAAALRGLAGSAIEALTGISMNTSNLIDMQHLFMALAFLLILVMLRGGLAEHINEMATEPRLDMGWFPGKTPS